MRLAVATPQDFGEICDCDVKGCFWLSALFSQDFGVSGCPESCSSHTGVVHDLGMSCALCPEGVQDFAVCFFGSCSFCSWTGQGFGVSCFFGSSWTKPALDLGVSCLHWLGVGLALAMSCCFCSSCRVDLSLGISCFLCSKETTGFDTSWCLTEDSQDLKGSCFFSWPSGSVSVSQHLGRFGFLASAASQDCSSSCLPEWSTSVR